MKSINPFSEEVIQTYVEQPKEEVNQRIDAGFECFEKKWSNLKLKARSQVIASIANVLEKKKDELSELITAEMGKPLSQSKSEIEKCAWVCRYYSENAEKFLAPLHIGTDFSIGKVVYQPLGPVLAIMPWNFPFWQVFRFAAPALMAGNTIVLKHAENVSGCALAIESLVLEAGLPQDAFVTVLVDKSNASFLMEHRRIQAITFTGSTSGGSAVASKAGEQLKKTVLELGGSDPYLILSDADIDLAAQRCAQSRMINGGQSCISAKRFIVVGSLKNQFEEKLVEHLSAIKMGDPRDPKTDLGPLARKDLRDQLHEQVEKSKRNGAQIRLGGEIPKETGYFYPPTVLTHVSEGMAAYHEELFGPVASVIEAQDDEDAIRIANDTDYGLGAAIFTRNTQRAVEIASERIQAGVCFINHFVQSDPRIPFGGVKKSGYGRELSHFGIHEFVNVKAVCEP